MKKKGRERQVILQLVSSMPSRSSKERLKSLGDGVLVKVKEARRRKGSQGGGGYLRFGTDYILIRKFIEETRKRKANGKRKGIQRGQEKSQ